MRASQPVNISMTVNQRRYDVILAGSSPFNTNSYIMNGLLSLSARHSHVGYKL